MAASIGVEKEVDESAKSTAETPADESKPENDAWNAYWVPAPPSPPSNCPMLTPDLVF